MAENPNTAEPQTPQRRWFQFRLRTMLIAVVLLGSAFGYVASEARIVRARKSFFAAREKRERQLSPVMLMRKTWTSYRGYIVAYSDATKSPGLVRRWLGDQPVGFIFAERGEPVDEIARLFPESAIFSEH